MSGHPNNNIRQTGNLMEIKSEKITRTTLVKYQGKIYCRIEDSDSIYWEYDDVRIFKFSYLTGNWYKKFISGWEICDQPHIEEEYRTKINEN